MMRIPSTAPSASVILAVAAAATYMVVWSLLASPFAAFPGDDLHTVMSVTANSKLALTDPTLLNDPSPVYQFLILVAQKVCNQLANTINRCDIGEHILHFAIASNAGVILLIGLITYRLTKNLSAQTGALAIYGFASWPVTYHFMVSYTVTTAMLVMLSIYFTVASDRAPRILAGLAGSTAALVMWSSSAGPLTAGLLIATGIFLLALRNGARSAPSRTPIVTGPEVTFLTSFVSIVVLIGCFAWGPYLDHLRQNIDNTHNIDALKKFGAVPQPLLFTYPRMLGEYGATYLFLLVASLVIIPFLIKFRNTTKPETYVLPSVTALAGFVVLHAMLIDLLPSTKLARAHFPTYPISVIVIATTGLMGYRWLRETRRAGTLTSVLYCVALFGVIVEGVRLSSETRHVRTAAAEYISNTRADIEWYLLLEDPHHGVMWTTFNWPLLDARSIQVSTGSALGIHGVFRSDRPHHAIQLIEASGIPALLATTNRKPIGIVMGPHGPGSGLSVASHASMDDFNLDSLPEFARLRSRARDIKTLPYYMHYPPFLFEEEITQSLYFSGRIPDYRLPEMGVTMFRL